MNDFVDNAMNFINENTTLLIIICVFLIFVLVLYLINSSIQAKKIERRKVEEVESNNVITNTNVEEEKVVTPEIVVKNDEVSTPVVEEVSEPVKEEVVEENVSSIPTEEISNESTIQEENTNEYVNSIDVEPEINDILLKDFSNNDTIVNIQEEKVEEPEEVTLNPIEKIDNIELNKEEPKTNSMYKNDKKISDIFGKKKEIENDDIDASEIDRILAKINNLQNSSSNDSTLEETQDFNNLF